MKRRRRRAKRDRERRKEKERNADGIISNAPQHVAPVGPPPGCQTCFFLCAIVSKAKVQRERGCRINVCPPTDFNIRLKIEPLVGAKRNSTSPSSPGTDELFPYCQLIRTTATEVRSTVGTHPEEQIATIRRPTCALMEKLKITTGLPLDHSTDSLAPPAREAFSSITSTNWPRSLLLLVCPNAPSRRGPRHFVLSIVIFSHYTP